MSRSRGVQDLDARGGIVLVELGDASPQAKDLPAGVEREIQRLSKLAYNALGLSG